MGTDLAPMENIGVSLTITAAFSDAESGGPEFRQSTLYAAPGTSKVARQSVLTAPSFTVVSLVVVYCEVEQTGIAGD